MSKELFAERVVQVDNGLQALGAEDGLEAELFRKVFRGFVEAHCGATQQGIPDWTAPKPAMTHIRAIHDLLNLMETDTDRLNWLAQTGNGVGLVHNDNAHWAVCFTGVQPVPGDEPEDMVTSYFVEESQWKPTVREAIDYAIQQEQAEEAEAAEDAQA